MRRIMWATGGVAAALFLQATPALACGGLVAPDGDVRLDKATTFVAWHNGVEHYVTSFAYQGSAPDVGWIVPLPAVPTSIQAAGKWTLQRLEREVNPPRFLLEGSADFAAAPQALVIEHVQVEALDVTVLKGSGQEVINWCIHNGFLLPPDTKAHLLQYAKGSPIFMAAKYNTAVAQQRGQNAGDGVPLLITMNTQQLWVPLEVLADDNTQVNADVFLLTDNQLRTANRSLFYPIFGDGGTSVDGAAGFTLARQEPMNPSLYRDLSSDRNMGWVPNSGYLTYLTLNAPSDDVRYDLGVGSDSVIRLASFGTPAPQLVVPSGAEVTTRYWTIAIAAMVPLLAVVAGFVMLRRRGRRAATSAG
jgi:hypothetical protein